MERQKQKEIVILALLVAILPPAWAVISPYIGIEVGPIALIAAGIYGTNGNKFSDAWKISVGYLAGDVWGVLSALVMAHTKLNPDLMLFMTLFVLGYLVVIISHKWPNIFFMPSWLAGWAIAMLTFNLTTGKPLMNMAIQVGIAMLVGVFYVGALLDKVHRIICKPKE